MADEERRIMLFMKQTIQAYWIVNVSDRIKDKTLAKGEIRKLILASLLDRGITISDVITS